LDCYDVSQINDKLNSFYIDYVIVSEIYTNKKIQNVVNSFERIWLNNDTSNFNVNLIQQTNIARSKDYILGSIDLPFFSMHEDLTLYSIFEKNFISFKRILNLE